MDKDYIVRWQSDLENTKESIFPVCDKPLHKIKENLPHWEEHENLWNGALIVAYCYKALAVLSPNYSQHFHKIVEPVGFPEN